MVEWQDILMWYFSWINSVALKTEKVKQMMTKLDPQVFI